MEWSHGPLAKKEPPKEEYKPETDPYQPEYERKDPYKSTAGHVTVEFFRQINASGIVPGSSQVGLSECRTTVCYDFKKKFRQTDERRKIPSNQRRSLWNPVSQRSHGPTPAEKLRQTKPKKKEERKIPSNRHWNPVNETESWFHA